MNERTSFLEIRHLPRHVISELGNILEINRSWETVMGLIPGKPWVPGEDLESALNFPKKYTSEDIRLVGFECSRYGRTGLEVLIEEWGTSGQIRPKVLDLIGLFQKTGLERAASYLQNLIMNEVTEDSTILNTEELHTMRIEDQNSTCIMSENDVIPSLKVNYDPSQFESLKNYNVPFITYEEVKNAAKSGIKIGEGAFGSVYKALVKLESIEITVAIKLFSEARELNVELMDKEKVFKTEVEILSNCAHKNIIKLESFSYNESDLALLYSFMKNGSLYDRLACLENSPPLPWRVRLSICEGTAEGIVYLHTIFQPPLIHRDIKSPNILLDYNFIPKLGDFGIVRFGGRSDNTIVRTTPSGTPMFMAPEAFRGDVSVKMDTFSFGIVILELLTGLPFFDQNRENRDILSLYNDFKGDETTLLDASAGAWDVTTGLSLFKLVKSCTKDKSDRPDMVETLKRIKSILCEMNETET